MTKLCRPPSSTGCRHAQRQSTPGSGPCPAHLSTACACMQALVLAQLTYQPHMHACMHAHARLWSLPSSPINRICMHAAMGSMDAAMGSMDAGRWSVPLPHRSMDCCRLCERHCERHCRPFAHLRCPPRADGCYCLAGLTQTRHHRVWRYALVPRCAVSCLAKRCATLAVWTLACTYSTYMRAYTYAYTYSTYMRHLGSMVRCGAYVYACIVSCRAASPSPFTLSLSHPPSP